VAGVACSPSHLALVDTGSTYMDPAVAPPPQILWQAHKPQGPEINLRTRTITWPDGSKFKFPLHGRTEVRHLQKYYEFPDAIDWHGRSGNQTGSLAGGESDSHPAAAWNINESLSSFTRAP
jgi:hypothetical protein